MIKIIKAISAFWDLKDLQTDKNTLGLHIISVCKTWELDNKDKNDLDERKKGRIIKSIRGLENDFFNLAVISNMINDIIENRCNSIFRDKDSLYIGILIESYYTNLRSIFDFIPIIINICLNNKNSCNYPDLDSFNKLLKFCQNPNNKDKLPEKLIEKIKDGKDIFNIVKDTRDAIIHRGEDSIIYRTDSEYYFAILKGDIIDRENILPNILDSEELYYPINEYLSKLTNKVIIFIEELAHIICDIWFDSENKKSLIYCALEGTVIPNFVKFLGW